VALNQGNGNALTGPALGNAGQVFESNGPGADPSFQDPIVSYNYVNLFNAVSATATQTSSTVRVSTFGQYGELIVTWASITGSPSGCTLQLKSADSLGNLTNNGSAVAVAPANGTSAILFTPAIYTAAQMQAVYACATTYPSAGTLSLDFVPSITVYSAQGPAAGLAGAWPVEQTDGSNVLGTSSHPVRNDPTGTTTQPVSAASLPLPTGAATSANQCGTSSPCEIAGHAGAAVDGATNAAPPANAILQGFVAATALPSATTGADTVAPMADKFGRQVVLNNAMRDLIKTTGGVQTTNATQTTLLAAQGSGVFADLVDLFISTESATACTISLTDGTNTYKVNVANQQGAGLHWNPPTPMPAASSNTAWQVTGCASVTLDYFGEFVLNIGPGGEFEASFIRLANLKGNIQAHPESDETFPRLKSQQRAVLQQLMTSPDPAIQAALREPANLGFIKSLVGLSELVVPGDDARNKQLREIQLLLTAEGFFAPQAPLTGDVAAPDNPNHAGSGAGSTIPAPEMKSTVPVDELLDDHATEFEECRRWASSDAGQIARAQNPAGFANVRAHAAEHAAALARQQAQAQAQTHGASLAARLKS
jgi:hypothetical protein